MQEIPSLENERCSKQRADQQANSSLNQKRRNSGKHHQSGPKTYPTEKQIVYQLFRIPIEIGRIKTFALIDTGASATIISAFLLGRIPKNEIRKEHAEKYRFRSICGIPMETVRTFDVNVRIHPNDKTRIKQTSHVINNLTEPCILGIDFITNNGSN